MARAHIWTGRTGNKQEGNPERCRQAVHDEGRWPGYHQCTRKPVVFRDIADPPHRGRFGFCKLHDPEAVAAKQAAKDAEWKRKWGAETRRREAKEKCIATLREIAAGHNDARSIALAAVQELDAAHA